MTPRSGRISAEGRFVYLTEVDISIDNGPGINEREFVSALLERHEHEVVCVLPEPTAPGVFHDERVRYVPAHQGRPSGYIQYLLGSIRAANSLLREGPIAGFVFRPDGTPLLPYVLARSTGRPILLKKLGLYSIFGDEVTRSALKNAVSRALLPMYRSVIQSAAAADVESPTYLEWVHERFGIERRRMKVIPNGVNTRVFTPRAEINNTADLDLGEFDTTVGYVGSLSRIRRLDVLLRAFARLRESEGTGLLLVGAGSDAASLEAEAKQLGIGHRVRFVGPVSYTDVPAWMRRFDVAVDPTAISMRTRCGVRVASFSQKIGQYLAVGVPVLAWSSADTSFLDTEEVGRTAPYPDEEALGHRLQELVDVVKAGGGGIHQRARRISLERFDSQLLADQRIVWWREMLLDCQAKPG